MSVLGSSGTSLGLLSRPRPEVPRPRPCHQRPRPWWGVLEAKARPRRQQDCCCHD